MAEKIYINNDGSANKFWSYTIDESTNKSVHVKWGRIGMDSKDQTKSFSSFSEMQKFIDSKVREKEKKGYKLVTADKLEDEKTTAKALGDRNKIKRLLWVSKRQNVLHKLPNYDNKEFVYVEILNSWTKEIT